MKENSWLKIKREQWKRAMLIPIVLDVREQKFESSDKPVREYERTLFLSMLVFSTIAKTVFFVTKWLGLYYVAFVLMAMVIAVSLFHLLVPPRLSNTRLTYLGCSLLFGWMLLLPDFH